MPARIRHIALSVKDIDATADFYEKAFGLKRSPKSEGPTAYRIYMSDGEINLALLQYKSEVGSGLKDPNEFVGIHHFGFQCDDLEAQQKKIEAAGGKFFFDLGDPDDDDFRAQVPRSERHHLRCQLEGLGDDVVQGRGTPDTRQGGGKQTRGEAQQAEGRCAPEEMIRGQRGPRGFMRQRLRTWTATPRAPCGRARS
jgi:catechol 2,3-dioxygenase-like lactoylglutathione lyase family enzyme